MKLLTITVLCLYNLTVLGAFLYLIDQRGWTPWSLLVPIMFLMASYKGNK